LDNNLLATHPEVAAEWHPTKNGDLLPSNVAPKSNKKAWWLGSCGHEWDAVIGSRTTKKPVGCRICSGREALAGFNDLGSQYPLVAKLWHPTLNGDLTPAKITSGSSKKVWWLCQNGHDFDDSPMKRIAAAHPCPVCINKRCVTGINDAATLHPHLIEEWDETKNEGLSLATLVVGSPKKVWWKCSLDHRWIAEVRSRTQDKTECLYCSGQRTLAGFNDLASQLPEIAAEWHPTKNGDLTPDKIHTGAGLSAWWKCNEGHEWQASVFDRKTRNYGCPYCSGRKSTQGENDIATTHPQLATEWHPTKNGDLTPSMISAGANVKAWWLGICGHEWETYTYNRKAGKGCPKCSHNTSRAEIAILEYIQELLPNIEVKHGDKKLLNGLQLDIYIPEKQFAIEFNGIYWHSEARGKTKTYHYDKWRNCKDKGVQLIQIWEDEWSRNPEQIKRMLAYKLGVTTESKVFARKTAVTPISSAEARKFLNENHVQGYASGSYYLGLRNKSTEELIAVLVLKKEAGTNGTVLNIIRYATSANVVGGFTKLLRSAEKTYRPASFVTFSDHCVSDGGLYRNNGFVDDKELPPDYMYVLRGERKHKFGYRLKRFQNDPDLLWEEGLTERQLAVLNGLERIWDAGKTRWVKHLK
jgi:hypothetical protein